MFSFEDCSECFQSNYTFMYQCYELDLKCLQIMKSQAVYRFIHFYVLWKSICVRPSVCRQLVKIRFSLFRQR